MSKGQQKLADWADNARHYQPERKVIPMNVASAILNKEIDESSELLREAYNSLTGSTGLDSPSPSPRNESSLCKRIRIYLSERK